MKKNIVVDKRPLNVGLIGGGKGAFIVHPHEKAIFMDGTRQVVCGALHQDPKIAMKEAGNWPHSIRGYRNYDEMLQKELTLPHGERMDAVLVVTPNHAHYDPVMKALAAGFPVACEKPLCLNLNQATDMVKMVRRTGVPFMLLHTYLGYWTSGLVRFIVRSGLIGGVRWVDAYYIQGWLATKLEATGQQQASWRVNPKFAGPSGCGGDIATHALMQLRFTTGLEVTEVQANLERFVPGRKLDDHFTAMCRLSNGGRALVRASQVCIGHKNDLGILIAGTKGEVRWMQEDPEHVIVDMLGRPQMKYSRANVSKGDGFLPENSTELDRLLNEPVIMPTIPSGHIEGFHDGFARLYRAFESTVRGWQQTRMALIDGSRFATVKDGWKGIAFIQACVESNKKNGAWVRMPRLR
jgi:predicted dehydrogenase